MEEGDIFSVCDAKNGDVIQQYIYKQNVDGTKGWQLINYKVLYHDEYFVTMGIDKMVLDNNGIILVTSDENVAKKYNFFKHGQLDFLKEVSLDEINELKVEKNHFVNLKTWALHLRNLK